MLPHDAENGWAGSVAFDNGPEPFAYVPGEVVVGGERGRDVAFSAFGARFDEETLPTFGPRSDADGPQFYRLRLRDDFDVMATVHDLQIEGAVAQPNHVLFAHGECCCGPHPADRWQGSVSGYPVHGSALEGYPVHGSAVEGYPVHGSSVFASPVHGSAVYGFPVHGSPVHGSPVHGSPVHGSRQNTGHGRSSAVPATAPSPPLRANPNQGGQLRPKILVLDSGLADPLMPNGLVAHGAGDYWQDAPDQDGDLFLDPCAGHGTFIAGLIQLLTPGCDIEVRRVLKNYGDGDEATIADVIDKATAAGDVALLNLSFGGYALQHMHVLASAIRGAQQRGTIVVASAGNDGTCRKSFPAPFSNYGSWVRACAPGVDIISSFFSYFNGPETAAPGDDDPDLFENWACWSGTSFSAPIVTAALAREIQLYNATGDQAVARVVDAPGLLRIPDFGTVVSLC
jgi:hypothetical protein